MKQAQAVEGQLAAALSFIKTFASNQQQELDLLRRKVPTCLTCRPPVCQVIVSSCPFQA